MLGFFYLYQSKAYAQQHQLKLDEIVLPSTSTVDVVTVIEAHSYYAKGKTKKAYRILTKELAKSKLYEVFFFTAYLEMEQAKYNQAITHFNQAIKIKPTANAYFYRAITYSKLKNYNTALSDYHLAIKMDSLMYAAYNNIALLKLENQGTGDLHQRDLEQSKNMLLKSIEREQNDKFVYFNLGLVCMGLNQFNEALTYLNKSILLDQYFDKAIYSRALTHFYLHRYTDALADFYICKNYNYNVEECNEFIELIEKIVVAMQRG